MSFSRAKPAGWAFGEILTSAQQNQLDIDHANAIDGVDGGTYNLAAPLTIQGDTVTIQTLVSTDIIVAPSATITALAVSGDATIGDDLTITDALSVGGAASFSGNITATAGSHSLGVTAFRFKTTTAADADTTLGPSDTGQVFFVETLTTNRTYTFSGSFLAGQWFLFKHRASGGATLNFSVGGSIVIQQAILWIHNGTTWRFLALSEVFAA